MRPRESHKRRVVEGRDVERQLGRVMVDKVLERRWRIFPSGKGPKVLGSELDGRAVGRSRKSLRQWMVLNVHREALMGV